MILLANAGYTFVILAVGVPVLLMAIFLPPVLSPKSHQLQTKLRFAIGAIGMILMGVSIHKTESSKKGWTPSNYSVNSRYHTGPIYTTAQPYKKPSSGQPGR
jgi:hypothetical protein